MEVITIPVNTGRIVILGDPHYDQFRKAKMDPFEVAGLEALNWGGIDALIIVGDLADAPQINWQRAHQLVGTIVDHWSVVCDEAGLSRAEQAGFAGRQFLNEYAFDCYGPVARLNPRRQRQ